MPERDAVWQETLINALGALDYTAEAARQALARSVAAGWLRAERHSRTQLAWAGVGSLGGGLWISPHVECKNELRQMGGDGSIAELQSFRAELGAIGEPERLIADAGNLNEVADAYRDFISSFRRLRPTTPEAVFRAQTVMVHEWRKFPFLDPDLPNAGAAVRMAANARASRSFWTS